mgnify:CR=1 FL=1
MVGGSVPSSGGSQGSVVVVFPVCPVVAVLAVGVAVGAAVESTVGAVDVADVACVVAGWGLRQPTSSVATSVHRAAIPLPFTTTGTPDVP